MEFQTNLGMNVLTGNAFPIPYETFFTGYQVVGTTGSGKTVGLRNICQQLMTDGSDKRSIIVLDPLGQFSADLLRFIASRRFCSDSVRERLVYLEPANTDYTTTLQPLLFHSRANRDYQCARSLDLLLRGFEDTEVMMMPRLRRFLHQTVFDLSGLGMPLAIAKVLLNPTLPEHPRLLERLPADSQAVWGDVMRFEGAKALDYLDSSRNRVALFSDFILLQRLFSSPVNRFDIGQFMDEGRIVICNLMPGAKNVHWTVSDTYGALIVNEVFNHGITRINESGEPNDCFLMVDEFQRFIQGPDFYNFIPVIRQMGIRAILAHQSFAQLKINEKFDLTAILDQCKSKLAFALSPGDAKILAEQWAVSTWDPDEVKHKVDSYRSRIKEYQKIILRGGNTTENVTTTETHQTKRAKGSSETRPPEQYLPTRGESQQTSYADVTGGSRAHAQGDSWQEHMQPVMEEWTEETGVQFRPFDEETHKWMLNLIEQDPGYCYAKLAHDSEIHQVSVDMLSRDSDPKLDDLVEELKEENFRRGPFITSSQADKELETVRHELLSGPVIKIDSDNEPDQATLDRHKELFG